jgi:hypothetical protein
MRLEVVDIASYREARMVEGGGPRGFRRAVAQDLEKRRDTYCPVTAESDSPAKEEALTPGPSPASGRGEQSESQS